MDMDERDTKKPTHSCYVDEHSRYKVRNSVAANVLRRCYFGCEMWNKIFICFPFTGRT